MVAALTPEKNVGMWLPAGHFAVGSTCLRPVVQVNLPQPWRKKQDYRSRNFARI